MNPVRWRQIKTLFDAALARPDGERAAFVADACRGDDDLRREVERLLEQPLDTRSLFQLVDPARVAHDIPDLVGTQLGAFTLTALIGRGGMGDVYRAYDTKLARNVAIKVVPNGSGADDGGRASFEREARLLASLNHPHIAAIHGVEELDGLRALVLELVEGETLADALRRSRIADRRGLRIHDAVSCARQIAEALQAAHDKGITHRDLKPANIVITPDGVVKLLDFGIAKVITGGQRSADLPQSPQTTIAATQPGLVAGTPGYMSPEQARGKPVDKRTDIWAFGCILYEMLSGDRAFAAATSPATVDAVVDSPPDWSRLPGDTPRAVRRVIRRCLEKDPEQRLGNIADARHVLDRVLAGRPQRWIAAAAAAIVIITVGLLLFRDRRPPGPERWQQLTRFSDSVGQPALSRDGKMLAFVRGATTFATSGEIYLKTLPDGEPVQLTRDRMNKMSPVFSPDGSRVAYSVLESGRWDTWQVPANGGQPRPWLENASGLTWTAKNRVLFSEIKDKSIHMGIVTSLDNRAESRDVYVPARASAMAHRSYLSPDSRSALIVEMVNGPWVPCRLVSMDGRSAARQVGPPDAGCTFAAWSADGQWMYLTSTAGGGAHIWRQRFPDGVPEQVTFGPTEQDGIAMAPDGRSFITAVASRQSSVWLHGPTGDRQISLEGFAFDPQFTPDGTKLMYRILKGASLLEASELRVTDLESGATEPMLPGISIFGIPSTTYAIARDRRHAVLAGFDSQGECKVWLVPLDGRSPARALPLNERENLGLRGMSPDGRWLISLKAAGDGVSAAPGRSLVAHSLAGDSDLPLIAPTAPTSLIETAVKWSRDGRTVFFVSAALDRGMQTRTYAFPLAPGKMFPSIPAGGFHSEAEMAATPGATSYDVYDFAPGPAEGTYAFTRESVQRNLYRVPVR